MIAGPGIIGNPKTLLAPLKRIKARSAFRHSIRILTILAKASFWAICFHYFGTKALLYVVASWTFLLGAKDITFVRVRLSSLRDPAKSKMAFAKSVATELTLIALRLAVLFVLAMIVAPFNEVVAAVIPMMAICAGFWARETFIATAAMHRTGGLRAYVSFFASFAALAAIVFFAENGFDPILSAIWALLIREGLTFFGFALVALMGCFGIGAKGGIEDIDDEDGGDVAAVIAPDGTAVRSAWKLLIADNVIYSRWRMMHFATRLVASGIAGPFGGVVTRIAFTYRKPKPYRHHGKRISVLKIVGYGLAAAIMISIVIYFGEKWGLLHVIGIAAFAFLFRVAALTINLLTWRQLSPLVGAPVRAQTRERKALNSSLDPSRDDQPTEPDARMVRREGDE